MPDTLELRTLPVKALADRADALEEELALTRALLRQARKLERDREQLRRLAAEMEAPRRREEPPA